LVSHGPLQGRRKHRKAGIAFLIKLPFSYVLFR
jgi:hypothetical protein